MSIEQVANVVEIAIDKLPYMESLYEQVKDQVEKNQCTRQGLANHITMLERKISILDATAFSSEQECRRKEQQIQELTAEKNRIERLIANILNGEGYSKLKHIVKENVKAILSEKRVLISISFAAVIQTLKVDPQMIKLIQNMPSMKDGEQSKDNNDNNNISEYLKFNNASLLNLAEKHYGNLVEALADNAITLTSASSNLELSLPSSSSSTFSGQSNQSSNSRVCSNEGDIAE